MRERMWAVGCGGLALLLALLSGGIGALVLFQSDRPSPLAWVMTGLPGLFALAAFAVAIRRKSDDDDPLEGERGLAVALTIVVVIAVAGFVLVAFLQPDFWFGAWDGS